MVDSRGCFVAVLLSLLFSTAEARAFCRMSTSASSPSPTMPCILCEDDDPSADCLYLEWRRRCMTVAIDEPGARDFGTEDLRAVLERSIRPWLAVDCPGGGPMFQIDLLTATSSVGAAEYNTDGGNINSIIFVSGWADRDYDPTAYALTTVWHSISTGEIFDADIEVNQDRGTYANCPDRTGCDDGRIDLQNVMTHEMGHFFGLGHSLETFATMHAISPPGEVTKRILRTDDITGFCTIYPPGSVPEGCDFEPRGGLSLTRGGGGGGCCSVAAAPAPEQAGWLVALVAVAALVRRRWR